ncbi:MAG: ABC transporter ATP-binding protein [Desulfobacteraceae bacterium]|nr:ABC transporter ATP-binding protein [Desulfobacteraceae bacterium]
MIEITNLSKVFTQNGERIVPLNNVNLSIGQGEFVTVVGPSGSGKSTFLLTIGGLIEPTRGEVRINGTSLYEVNNKERARIRLRVLGFMFQTFNLIPYLTALENVEVPMSLAGIPGKEQRRKTLELLDRVGLSHRVKHRPAQLSVGERQRVALARTVANDPSIILADEPTGNLDPKLSSEILEYFKQFSENGITVIMVTHDHQSAAESDHKLQIINGVVTEFHSNQREEYHA